MGGTLGVGGVPCFSCYHTGVRVMVCRALSLLSMSSSLGWCGGLQLNVIWPPGAPPPDQTALCVHPDRSLGGSTPSPPWARRGPLPQKPESTVKRGNGAEKQPEPPPPIKKIHHGRIRRPPRVHPLLSNARSLSLSLLHILNLSIYLYSHLFTFSFKISAYKRVYKLKDNFLLVLSL